MLKFKPPSDEEINCASELVISACKTAYNSNLECVTLKGSAVKGDFIPGYSDFDFHVFLNPQVMDDERTPQTDYALKFQKTFGHIRPEDFGASQFQIYFINSKRYPPDWVPPVKGTFKVILGKLPASAREADDATYIRNARRYLETADEARRTMIGRFVDKPNGRVLPFVRLLGTTLKNYMYSVLVVLEEKPKDMFNLRLDQMIPPIEKGIYSEGYFTVFFEHINDWSKVQRDSDYAREAFKEGIEALREITVWKQSLK